MSSPTTAELLAYAKSKAEKANAELLRLQKQMDFENSFIPDGKVHVVIRRGIDRGDFQGILGVFEDSKEAYRFANGLAGYGIGKDVFVEPFTFYPKKDS